MLVKSPRLILLTAIVGVSGCAPARTAPAASGRFSAVSQSGAPRGPVGQEMVGDALRFRTVGPMNGGRVTTVTGIPSEPKTFYMGTTGGGVWRTTDAGATWVNVSDGQIPLGSMGSIDVATSDPSIVWVGTGSDGIRSNVSTGRGVYRSTDGAKTWTFVGLRDAGQIGAVRIHPTNPDIVFVAAVGNAFKPNAERGVFRTKDGGRTWQKVLFISDSTGAVDVEFQPGNPQVLYASMWRGERKPWTIISGAWEGGIYKSTDGGDTWTKLGGGLPQGLFGKSNLALSAANPQRVYAVIEAQPGRGLYRSDDSGTTWTLVNEQQSLTARPFYFTNITADPTDADVVYVMTQSTSKSTDGGKTMSYASAPHGDVHDLWINPNDTKLMVIGDDGGAAVSVDGGETWSTQENQLTAELYGVTVDSQTPFRLYGAQQDDGTWIIPSRPIGRNGGILGGPGCETGPVVPHPTDPDIVYGSCKGDVQRLRLSTGFYSGYDVGVEQLYGIEPRDLAYRIVRTPPMVTSPHDPAILYFGTQYLHRTRDGGVRWERISPDLTANDPRFQGISGEPITRDMTGEELYSSLYAIRESYLQKGVIWVGANDGPIHVTQNDGRRWKNVTPPDLAPGGRVQNIEPSRHRVGTAYVAVVRYLLGDFKPYLYRIDDFGRSWTLLTPGDNGIPDDAPTRVIREDPVRPGLLYAGTEFGLYVSFDNGATWKSLQLNLPHTPITNLEIHQQNLVLSTQGRGFWILDNIAPLQQWNDSLAMKRAHLFTLSRGSRGIYGGQPKSSGRYGIEYPAVGMDIDYWIGKGLRPKLELEILDGDSVIAQYFGASGEKVAGDSLANTPGVHRFTWTYRYRIGGREVTAPPGKYTVRLIADRDTLTQRVVVELDAAAKREGLTEKGLREQIAFANQVRALGADIDQATARLAEARRRLEASEQVGANADTLSQIKSLQAELQDGPSPYGRPGLRNKVRVLEGSVSTRGDQLVGSQLLERYRALRKTVDEFTAKVDRVLGATQSR